ncbi:uncharacterized protein A1O5_06901 [Cladophialophora psammophila CBS 110553]|uniref:Uncharacterized protein n=1 Tax=Cladophialophora psammophila CBS 110553 TaxID=1182543 RepID=W9XHL1_9EURO|nr:uncharacterized protein A1O5_06901 [Cladophialophora psammophila CBS 110553]EXJ69829.1 hypothetical protein A1O5_06901 [Cladophialophora psammophila CBS 110553]
MQSQRFEISVSSFEKYNPNPFIVFWTVLISLTQQGLGQASTFLLKGTDPSGPSIDLEAISGCRNWVLLQISEIAALDAWKQGCKRAGALDVVELVGRAGPIKDTLVTPLAQHEASLVDASNRANNILKWLVHSLLSRRAARTIRGRERDTRSRYLF